MSWLLIIGLVLVAPVLIFSLISVGMVLYAMASEEPGLAMVTASLVMALVGLVCIFVSVSPDPSRPPVPPTVEKAP